MILSIDIGSSAIKAGLISSNGTLHSIKKIPCRFDTGSWLRGIKEIFNAFKGAFKSLKAIAVSGNGPTLVAVDDTGNPLCPPVSWMDTHYLKYMDSLKNISGIDVKLEYYLAKVYYLKQEKPQIYDRTRWFLPCPEYICYYLTDNPYGYIYSREARKYLWTPESIRLLGLDSNKFPPYISPGKIVGKLSSRVAKKLDVPGGIPVVVCGTDFLMSILGTGVVQPGQVCDRAGTSEGLNICLESKPVETPLLVMPHIIEGYYNASGILATAGMAFEWILKVTGQTTRDYDSLFREVDKVEPGSNGLIFLPFLHPPRPGVWKSSMQGSFTGLSLEHTAIHMVRAVLEATGMAMKDILRVIEKTPSIGHEIEEIRVTGGAASSAFWNRLRADITGKRIFVPQIRDSELAGAACMGYFATGQYTSPAESASQIVRPGKIFEPDSRRHKKYNDLFKNYRRMYNALEQVY